MQNPNIHTSSLLEALGLTFESAQIKQFLTPKGSIGCELTLDIVQELGDRLQAIFEAGRIKQNDLFIIFTRKSWCNQRCVVMRRGLPRG